MVRCTTIYGDIKEVRAEKLVFRPAAYGLIVHENKILLLNTKSTGKWWFPGGGIELGETLYQGLQREVKEETGISATIVRLLDFMESFFYYNPLDEAYHNFSFFFLCTTRSTKLIADKAVDDLESDKPRWKEVTSLTASAFQPPADLIFSRHYQSLVATSNQ